VYCVSQILLYAVYLPERHLTAPLSAQLLNVNTGLLRGAISHFLSDVHTARQPSGLQLCFMYRGSQVQTLNWKLAVLTEVSLALRMSEESVALKGFFQMRSKALFHQLS